ncbi:MAG: PspC domain-containing protein [Candidatus Nanopelagicales bacterium]
MTEQPSASSAEPGPASPAPPNPPPTYAPPPYTQPPYTQPSYSQPTAQPNAQPSARPPLRRSVDDRVIAGVCGGIGRTLGIDPVIPRVVLAVLTLFGGAGLLIYGVAWLFVPEDGARVSAAEAFAQRNGRGLTVVLAVIAAIVLLPVAIGGLWFLGEWGPWGGPGIGPLIIIAIVGGIVWLAIRDRQPSGPPPTPVAYGATGEPVTGPAAPTQPQAPYQYESWSGQAGQPAAYTAPQTPSTPAAAATPPGVAATATTAPPSAYATPPAYAPSPGGGYGPPSYPPYAPPRPYVPPTPPRRRERSMLGVLTISAAALTAGVLWLLELADAIDLDWIVYPASILGIIALGLLAGSLFGRARWLVVLGIPLVFVTVAAGHVTTWGNGEVGERQWQPTTLSEARGPWELGIGEARLDLTGVQGIDRLSRDLEVTAELGIGDLRVYVPRDVPLTVSADVGLGQVEVVSPTGRGVTEDGVDVSFDRSFGDTSDPTIVLDVEIGAGQLEVIREAA